MTCLYTVSNVSTYNPNSLHSISQLSPTFVWRPNISYTIHIVRYVTHVIKPHLICDSVLSSDWRLIRQEEDVS